MRDIMIDIETLGTGPGAVVLTIGAIRFDPFADDRESVDLENKKINMDVFYRRVDPESFTWPSAFIHDATLEWWSKQAPEVREEAFTEVDRVSIADAMRDLYKWTGAIS